MVDSVRKRMYIAGGPGGKSVGPAVHEYLAKSLGFDWTCEFLQYTDVEEVIKLFRRSDFVGALVTMPHKRTIIPLLDGADEFVQEIGACNMIVRSENGGLRATNTDWLGIRDALLAETPSPPQTEPAMVYGAGGAARAAVYALVAGLGYRIVYIVNRDDLEVEELVADVQKYTKTPRPKLIHITSIEQALELSPPQHVVCNVPDFTPQTSSELTASQILNDFLQRRTDGTGTLLDMCYNPKPETRNIRLAKAALWRTVPGYHVVAYQFEPQWRLWTGRDIDSDAASALCFKLLGVS